MYGIENSFMGRQKKERKYGTVIINFRTAVFYANDDNYDNDDDDDAGMYNTIPSLL